MLQKLSDHLTMVFTDYGFTYSNCLLIEDDSNLLIESGAGKSLDMLDKSKVDIVLNTHHHIDHIRGNNFFPKAKIYLHSIEHEHMLKPENLTATEGWNELMSTDITEAAQQMAITQEDFSAPWRVDGAIYDGQVIDCGSTKLAVMHTPGHCAGHCSFWFPDEDIIFLGDICLTQAGPWYGEASASIDDLISSIDRMVALKPGRAVTSHINHIVDDPEPVLVEYKNRIFKREQRIIESLKERPKNIHQLADQHLIYREHPTDFVLFWEKCMINKHLERLIKFSFIEAHEDGLFCIN